MGPLVRGRALALLLVASTLAAGCTTPGGQPCPPAWAPQPPGCGGTQAPSGPPAVSVTHQGDSSDPKPAASTLPPKTTPTVANDAPKATPPVTRDPTRIQHYLPSLVDIYGPEVRDTVDLSLSPTIVNGLGLPGTESAASQQWMREQKALGARHISGISIWNNDNWKKVSDLPPELATAYVLDLDGNPVIVQESIFLNILDPAYQEYLRAGIRSHIDAGTDGFSIDEHFGTAWALDPLGEGPFDKFALAGFPAYLGQHYTPEELRQKGIQDLSTFDYKQFLLDHGLRDDYRTHKRDGTVPFVEDYYEYLRAAAAGVIQGLIDYVHAYSAQKGRSTFIAANLGSLETTARFYSSIDVFLFEHGWLPDWRQNLNKTFPAGEPVGPEIKFLLSQDKTAVVGYSIEGDGRVMMRLGTEPSTRLMTHEFAECYANGGYYDPVYQLDWIGIKFTSDRALLRPFYSFVREHPGFFLNRTTSPEVAVLHARVFLDDGMALDATRGFSTMLARANVPHDVLGLDQVGNLSKYKVVLTSGVGWSQHDLDALLAYARGGGVVFASDDRFATKDEAYRPVDRPELTAVKTEGAHAIGSGAFVFSRDYVWWRLWSNQDPASAAKVLAVVNGSAQPDAAPASVQLLPFTGKDGRFLVHILNYDFNGTDFTHRSDLDVRVKLPSGYSLGGKALRIASPDFVGNVTASYHEADGWVSFTVPSLHVWDVAAFE
ncbi:MAG: hypothetical protein WDA16_03810 [Candidatus Thermoplasmatota archaeon]